MRWLALVSFLLGIYPIIGVGLRGGLLAVAIGCIGGMIYRGMKTRYVLLSIILIFILFQSINVLSQLGKLPAALVQHLNLADAIQYQGTGRGKIWQVVWLVFQEHPLFGVGLNRFVAISGQYPQLLSHFQGAHNDYLAAAVELGIPGFLLLFGGDLLIVINLFKAKRFDSDTRSKYLQATILALLVATITGAMFVQLIQLKLFWIARALGIVASQGTIWKKRITE
jgi:O-antigen ligase